MNASPVVGNVRAPYGSNHHIGVKLIGIILAGVMLSPAFAYQSQEIKSASEQAAGTFGYSVSGVPDTNGDGRGDVLVGALFEGAGTGFGSAGRAYLFDGATGMVLREFESPNKQMNGGFGVSVSGIPDVNGDGRGDVIIGAQYENPDPSPTAAGRAYIFDGNTGNLLHELMSPNEEFSSFFGYSVSGVPDTNGNSRGDVIVGAPNDDPGASPDNSGRAYLFDGDSGSLLRELNSANQEEGGQFGWSVGGIPDVNGDGRGDVVVGAPEEDPGEGTPDHVGGAYIFDGNSGGLLWELSAPASTGMGEFGYSVSGTPDVTGDGRGDVVVGAWQQTSVGSPGFAGRAYVYNGATGSLIHELRSTEEQNFALFGASVSGVQDLNGDGRGDIVVGSPRENRGAEPSDTGRAFVFDGATGEILAVYKSPNPEAFGQFGAAVAGVPDMDNDGRGDVVVTAPNEDPDDSPDEAGRAYIISSEPPEIEVTPLALAFGDRDIDLGPTADQTVTLDNLGCIALEFVGAGIALTGSNAAEFLLSVAPSVENLTSDVTREVFVAFDPSSPGVKTANLTITTNDSDEPAVNVSLTGAGVGIGPSPTPSQTPTPGGLADYDVAPDQPDGRIDARDLLKWFGDIQDGSPTRDLLFDFSRFWKTIDLR